MTTLDARINRWIHLGRMLEASRHDPEGWVARFAGSTFPITVDWATDALILRANVCSERSEIGVVEFEHRGRLMVVFDPITVEADEEMSARYRVAFHFSTPIDA